jgi:hypothetical protein
MINSDNQVQPINMNSGRLEEIVEQTSILPQSFENIANQINTQSENMHLDAQKNNTLLGRVASTQAYYHNDALTKAQSQFSSTQNLINDSTQALSRKISEVPTQFTILCKVLKKESLSTCKK